MNFDIIILGAGPGGYETAVEAAREGLSVAVVERDHLGGTCLNRGCIPTKALLRSAEVLDIINRAEEFGVTVNVAAIDYSRAVERKNSVVGQLREGVATLLSNPLITVVKGEGEIVSPREVKVGDTLLTADRAIIIATGSAPAALPIEGADLTITSDDLLAMTDLPKSMVIIGGGVIGLEFAGILNSFGVDVTVVEFCKEILPNFDHDIAKRLRTSMSRRGVTFAVSAAVTGVSVADDGRRIVTYDRKGKVASFEAEAVLMAVGRRPVVPKGVEEAGVAVGRRGIEVDDNMLTSVAGVYAIGDVNGRCMLAHAASAQGKVALAHILGRKSAINLDVVPSAVFTSPEAAMVGLTEEAATDRGVEYDVRRTTFRANGKALAMGESDGLVKILKAKESGKIIGCHVLGPHASDLVAGTALAISRGLTAADILATIHSHPTLSEVIISALN